MGPPPGSQSADQRQPPVGQNQDEPHRLRGPEQPSVNDRSRRIVADEQLAPRSGVVGDTLEGDGANGLRASWRIMSLACPVDHFFIDAGLTIPDRYISVIVAAMFTNKSDHCIPAAPIEGLQLLDSLGGAHQCATATIESHPAFRIGPVADSETIAGHLFYLIPADVDVASIRWHYGSDTLTWQI